MSRFEELKALVAAAEADFNKFYNEGNKAAGTRVRAAMQELKNFAQTIRTEVQTIKNEGKPEGESTPS
ncbi:MAG: histone H1 [Kofleriaceae bacterium]|nr:MAG: histone H1 [Kofleriaceae bacterium]MBZ0236236.1 histone H1 [Kofleriaceae bacterium]